MREIYLDNSATTRVCDSAIEEMVRVMRYDYGNPSSLHTLGFNAERLMEKSRKTISDFINCEKDSIYFTSGGTESNNLAIIGAMSRVKNNDGNIVVTSVEHPSVLNTVKHLEECGFEVRYVEPDEHGNISIEKFYEVIDENTKLVSCMMVNNEVGTVYRVEEIKRIVRSRRSKALVHVDAVQAFGKVAINVKKLQIDLMSISAHKVHGPKGVGALYVRKGVNILPLFFGGGQEHQIRPGTQAVPLIVGFGEAVRELSNCKDTYTKIKELNDYCRERLSEIERVRINSTSDSLPYIINFSVRGIKSETMLHYLASKGIYVSSGSACSKGRKSYVLKSLGMSDDLIDTSIRVSFCRYNTKEDVDSLILEIKNALRSLINI